MSRNKTNWKEFHIKYIHITIFRIEIWSIIHNATVGYRREDVMHKGFKRLGVSRFESILTTFWDTRYLKSFKKNPSGINSTLIDFLRHFLFQKCQKKAFQPHIFLPDSQLHPIFKQLTTLRLFKCRL